MLRRWHCFLAAAIPLFLSWTQANAGLIMSTSRAAFEAQGTIVYNSNFSDFGTGFTSLSNPFTRGHVTYTTGDNLVVGTGTGYSPVQNLLCYNFWTPLTGTVETSSTTYNMFGFDAGVLGRIDPVSMTITTNLGSYTFSGQSIIAGNTGLNFRGFTTTLATEYITGFNISTLAAGSAVGITNVDVGHLQEVPVPASITMTGIGIVCLGLGAMRRRFSMQLSTK